MASRASSPDETRAGVDLTNLDAELFAGADATKRDLIDYLDAVSNRLVPALQGRPLSVIRVRPGSPAFMQKNLPKYAPDWIERTTIWAEASHREVAYALCNDRRTLLWFGNQRSVEYHVTLAGAGDSNPDYLIMDLDPPEGSAFGAVVAAAGTVRQALLDAGLTGAVKTSGAKGLHVFVPLEESADLEQAAAATRALAARAEKLDPDTGTTAYLLEDRAGKVFLDSTRVGGATVVAAYSPRVRPGVPVSFPLAWEELPAVKPADFTIKTALDRLGDHDAWRELMPARQPLPADLVEEGRAIPAARVAAMHEGKRRTRARRGS